MNTLKSISNTCSYIFQILFILYYYVEKQHILRHLVYRHNYCFAHMMTGTPVLESIVIANCITVTTERGKGQNILFVCYARRSIII